MTSPSVDRDGGAALLSRLRRDSAIACSVLAAVCFLGWPARPRIGLGVLGGGVLIGLAFWAIRGAVVAVTARAETGKNPRNSRGFALVKFFTRHAILALVAYGMMARLQLHPVGLLIGVSSMVVAAAAEAARTRRR